jgi:hypothetical protein
LKDCFENVEGLTLKSRKREKRKEKTATDAKPNIFFPQAPPRNKGDAIRIKTSL